MTDSTPTPVDTDTLPPTQYLILEVLAARYRTGEQVWTFPKRLRPQLEVLAALGLVGWKSGIVYGTVLAWFTDAGLAAALLDGYTPRPVAAAERIRKLIDSYPAGSDFAESGTQELFRRVLDGPDV